MLQANEHVSRGDYEGFLSFCTENIEWEFVGDKIIRGKDEVRQYMNNTYIEPPRFDVNELVAERGTVVVTGHISIKQPNGETTDYAYCDIWRFRDKKMTSLKAFVIASR